MNKSKYPEQNGRRNQNCKNSSITAEISASHALDYELWPFCLELINFKIQVFGIITQEIPTMPQAITDLKSQHLAAEIYYKRSQYSTQMCYSF